MLEVLPAYRRRGVGEALLRGAVRLALVGDAAARLEAFLAETGPSQD